MPATRMGQRPNYLTTQPPNHPTTMPIEIEVPSVGESVTEGRLGRWLKPDGAAVQRDEMVCELETDKATAEVPAPAAGVLKHIAKEGDTVRIGAVIGSIDPKAA